MYDQSRTIITIGKISLTTNIVIDVPNRATLAVETEGLFPWLVHLNNESNVCKQTSSLERKFVH